MSVADDLYAAYETETAPPAQILIMLYDRLLRDLDVGAAALTEPVDLNSANSALCHAQDILMELVLALNPGVWDGAESAGVLYHWALRELASANMKKEPSYITPVRVALSELRGAFAGAADQVATERRSAGRVGV